MIQSVGQFLINNHIPKQYQIGKGSASDIQKSIENWARNDPQSYAENIPALKRIADDITMYEGFSIGLDDIEPMVKQRKQLLKKYQPMFDNASSINKKKKIVSDALQEGAKLSMRGSGSLIDMVSTKTRGNPAQLMKNVLSPVTAREPDETPYPYLIDKSYAEGLSPGSYWVSAIESRNATVTGKMGTAEPGDFGKQMFNALNSVVVSSADCGTDNGIYMKSSDPNIIDRYLAKSTPHIGQRGALITEKMALNAQKRKIGEIMVRSPMTCEARNGVCQKCYGLNTSGKLHSIGSNVGTLAAQSLAEPLTQMRLSTKHGVQLGSASPEDVGMRGFRKLLSKPKIFPNKSALAQVSGVVNKIRKAPQGGYYVYVNGLEHYVPINNNVVVKEGQRVAAGDSVSDGLKDPREFTQLRGLGSGRSYLTQALYNAYNPLDTKTGERTGIPIDKRHLEVLAKKDLNHVVIENHNDTFSKGDIVEYNQLKNYLSRSKKEVHTVKAIGLRLAKEYMHYTVGTEVTPNIMNTLIKRGINKVWVTEREIQFTPHVTNIRQVPLLKKNFLARMSHHELKNSLIDAATKGQVADIKGYDPVPAFIHGVTFGEGIDGQY